MSEPMLELVNVTAGYGRSMVLHDVSLTVPAGSGVALMGHNGAGKTTLLRVAVGLVPVRSGKVLIDGEDVTKLRPHARVRRGLGYVPQGQLCFPQMTTLENLQLVSTVERHRRGAGHLPRAARAAVTTSGTALRWSAPAAVDRADVADQAAAAHPRRADRGHPAERGGRDRARDRRTQRRGDLSVLLVEQHVGFALRATSSYYVLESGRVTASGEGGAGAVDVVRDAMAV